MRNAVSGVLHGNLISLDEAIPDLDGRRVRLILEPEEPAEAVLSAEEQARLWQEWVDKGPDGPIEDEDGAELP